MKAILTETKGDLPGIRFSWGIRMFLFLASLTLVMASFAVSLAQDSEIGNVNGYAPQKTVRDYEVGGNPDSGAFDYGKVDLRVGVWLDREENEIYQRGEEMGAGFQTNQDAYAVVYRIDVDGLVTVLWPRSRMDDGFVFGGHEYLLPVAGAAKLRVATNEGEGFVEALVSKYPYDLRDLEIDFHHELGADRFGFRVAGDPFLAMNEVNYAVTGLENSEEYVVTNYASYFVHREVEHPRYLCNQCHIEDDVAYEPYRDTCTLEITYDYGWVNSWYADYGYYPVYANPVYVYVDPWTWRPWINFWYWPSYVCAPYYGYGWYGGGCYSWGYSPYYRGDCYTSYNNGNPRYRPLTKGDGEGPRTKTREYGSVSRMVSGETPDSRQRDAMTNRMRMSDLDGVKGRSSNLAATGVRGGSGGGVKATPRDRPRFAEGVRVRGNVGLRIRDGGSSASRTRTSGSRGTESDFRHRAGGSGGRSGLVPVARGAGSATTVRGGSGSRTGGAVVDPKTGSRSGGSASQRNIKPVEPRQKGTRVWNSGRGGKSEDRTNRTRQVRPGSSRNGRSSTGDRTRSGGSIKTRSGGSKNSPNSVKPRSGSSRNKSSGTKSSGSVGSKGSRSQSSSGGGRSSGGGSRSSGGSRSGGGSSKGGSRGGGTSHRR